MVSAKAKVKTLSEMEKRIMADIKFEIEMNELLSAKELAEESIARALEQCGALWETNAKQLSPVDTGRLRNSIEHHAENETTMVVETDVEYAVYQEMGTRYQSGTPFIKPSGEQLVQTFKQVIENELKR